MPEKPSSSFDDPFADLFEKLPDPRASRAGGDVRNDASSGGPADPAPSLGSADTPAPLSRRAARAASSPRGRISTPGGPASGSSREAETAEPVDSRRVTPRPVAATAPLEDLFAGRRGTEEIGRTPPPRDPRKRRLGGVIVLAIVLALLGGLVAGGLYVWNTYEDGIRAFMGWEDPKDYEPGLANGEALLTISSGDTGGPISQKLYDAGVTMTPEAFYDYLIDSEQNPSFVPGVFRLQLQMTSAAALEAIMDPANKMENSALVREGLTVEQTLPLLAEGIGLPLEDFEAAVTDPAAYGVAASSLEGWLFPAVYEFDPGVTATQVVQRMVDRTVQSLDQAGVPVEDRQRILTIASIIQREARVAEDFYKVSRVIQNRLDPGNQETFGLLQMDSTAQYGIGEQDGTASSSEEALTNDNPWNTYVVAGLPAGPIANPGDTAIDAALRPAEGPWLYFVTVNLNTGETVFTSTAAEHEQAVEQWRSWCSENPDAGC